MTENPSSNWTGLAERFGRGLGEGVSDLYLSFEQITGHKRAESKLSVEATPLESGVETAGRIAGRTLEFLALFGVAKLATMPLKGLRFAGLAESSLSCLPSYAASGTLGFMLPTPEGGVDFGTRLEDTAISLGGTFAWYRSSAWLASKGMAQSVLRDTSNFGLSSLASGATNFTLSEAQRLAGLVPSVFSGGPVELARSLRAPSPGRFIPVPAAVEDAAPKFIARNAVFTSF